MTPLQQAEKIVESWREEYDFWSLCHWVANRPKGHVIIRPDFIGIAEEDGTTINVWLAIGKDGVRKAMELAPEHITHAAWLRLSKRKEDTPTIWPLDKIRRFIHGSPST